MKRKSIILTSRTVTILTILILMISGFLLWIFIRSQNQMVKAENETKSLVSLDYPVKRVNQFYWSTFDESTFTMDFTDKKNKQRYAIVTAEGGDIQYYTPNDIINRDEALSIAASENKLDKLLNTRLGLLHKKPIWEIVFKDEHDALTYYYIDAKSGKWLQTIGNL